MTIKCYTFIPWNCPYPYLLNCVWFININLCAQNTLVYHRQHTRFNFSYKWWTSNGSFCRELQICILPPFSDPLGHYWVDHFWCVSVNSTFTWNSNTIECNVCVVIKSFQIFFVAFDDVLILRLLKANYTLIFIKILSNLPHLPTLVHSSILKKYLNVNLDINTANVPRRHGSRVLCFLVWINLFPLPHSYITL